MAERGHSRKVHSKGDERGHAKDSDGWMVHI